MKRRVHREGKIVLWWRRNDRRYGLWWRLGNGAAAVLVLASIALPVASQLWKSNKYQLSAQALQLVGNSDNTLAKQLKYNPQTASYEFNKDAIQTGTESGLPAAVQKASAGMANSNPKTYALDVPTDMSKGVTYHDVNSQLSFGLVPQFTGMDGKPQQGRIVFPLSGEHAGNQAVYTLKNNGLKEDIVVPEVTQDTMRFSYKLDLPNSLEARVIPDGDGAIGIYSADASLFGDITYGSEADKQRVADARRDNVKSSLVFGLPAPVVKDVNGKDVGNARFELQGNTLSVVADDLAGTKGAITIDPSVVFTSTSDLQSGGNNEGNIDFAVSGQANRAALTGGTLSGGWGNSTTILSNTDGLAAVAYNGYLYYLGGNLVGVKYSAISSSDGTLGGWAAATDLSTAVNYPRAFVYNGYLYRVGGQQGASYVASTEYAPINSDGSLGSWTATTSMGSARSAAAGAVYNGYMYIMGGYDGSVRNDVQYAPINANGTLGTWTTTTSFTTTRSSLSGFAFNGYMYIMGGYNGASTYYNDVQYAVINSDGTVGTWTATTSFATGRAGAMVSVYNGYVYLTGGTANLTTGRTDTQYAAINTNGTIGTWLTTTTLGTGGWSAGTAAYNGYVYVLGGRTGASSWTNAAQFAKIDPAGRPVAFATLSNNFATARALSCSVAYNGYLYNIGGSTTDSTSSNSTLTQYTALNSTGGNGTWTSTTALPEARGSANCVAYNGYLYVIGGYTGTSTQSANVRYVPINTNGTLGTWVTTAPDLPHTAVHGGVFVYGTSSGAYLYSVGGYNSSASNVHTAVFHAPLTVSTGAVGSWTTSGNAMSQNYYARGFAQVGKYLYAFGGQTSSPVTSVEYAVINADGTVGTWASTGSLNTAIAYTNATTVNGCMYAVGGVDNSAVSLATVQYACPNANGTITAWLNGPNLTVGTADLAVTSYNGYIYGVGGYTTSVQTTTQSAYVNNGGSGVNSTWAQTASNLAAGRKYSASTAYNGYLYVVGGVNQSSADTNDVQYAQLGSTGNTGTFSTDARTFTTVRESAMTVAYAGYLYVMGGKNNPSTVLGDSQYATIGSSGALTANFASTTSFVTGTGNDTGRQGSCAVAYNGYMYVTGGVDSSSRHADTRYAAINSNGTLGTWADSGNNFATARGYHSCFVANGYLYVLGGGTGAANLNDVQSAPINSNGTLGAWVYTKPFNGVRETAIAGYSNGFAYIYSGCSNTACNSYLGDTQYAPVNANGTLGNWQRSTSSLDGASAVVGEGTGVLYNGYMYVSGGNGAANTAANFFAPLNVLSRQGRYSKYIDLGIPTNITGIPYNGSVPISGRSPGQIPVLYRVADYTAVFGAANQYSSTIIPGTFNCLPGNPNYARYILVTFLLNDSSSNGIFPDAAGTAANLTDFTVNYTPIHPDSNIRLRGGKTLQAGNMSALDTCSGT